MHEQKGVADNEEDGKSILAFQQHCQLKEPHATNAKERGVGKKVLMWNKKIYLVRN